MNPTPTPAPPSPGSAVSPPAAERTPTKVASIVGTPGMCSDDGRAITYYWRLFINDCGGRGFWTERYAESNEAAREWCAANGYEVQREAWT